MGNRKKGKRFAGSKLQVESCTCRLQLVFATKTIQKVKVHKSKGKNRMSKIKTITTCIVAFLLLLALSACGGTDLEGQSQAPQALENQIVPSPNETGIYTTIAGFEHGDPGRQHVFDAAVFTGDLNNPRSNRINIRTTTDDYPGIYNLVTRNQDELFVYFGSFGDVEVSKGPALARIDANSLEEVWRISVADLTPQDWNYPGVVGLHGNGYLYVVVGNVIAKIDPDTGELLNSNDLPSEDPINSAYNGYVTSSDGTIFVKPIYRSCDTLGGQALMECPDAETPSILSAIDPDTLDVIGQAEVIEPVFGRISVGTHQGSDYVYMQGISTLFRYRWEDGALTFDDNWRFTVPLAEGENGAASPAIGEDWLFFQTNGLPSEAPMTVWAVSTSDADQTFSVAPFSDLMTDQSFNISKGSFDAANGRVYAVDTLAGYAASILFGPATGFEVDWREPQQSLSYQTLINPAEERVIVMSDISGRGSRINPFKAQNEQLVFRNAQTGEELARTDNLPRLVSGATITPGFDGRIYFPAADGKLYEITVQADT